MMTAVSVNNNVTPLPVTNAAPVVAGASPVVTQAAGDTVQLSTRSAGRRGFGWAMRKILPRPIVNGYGRLDKMLSGIPGYAKLPMLDKGFILLQSVFDIVQAGKDTVSGFSQEQGTWFDKITSGMMSGIKSFGKAVGVLAASTVLAYSLPALVGGGILGTVAGLGGAIGGSMLSRYVLDKIVPTHGHIQNGTTGFNPAKDTPSSGDEIVKQLDYTWRNRTFDPHAHIPSEWLNVDRNFDPRRL